MLSTSIWVWESPSTMSSICTSATRSLTRGITSSPDPLLLDLCHVFPSPIKVWRTTTWLPLVNSTTVFTIQLGRESQVGYPRFRSLLFFLFSWSMGSSSLASPFLYSFCISFTFDSDFMILTIALLLKCFLQIKGTLLLDSALSTLRVSTRCWGPRYSWVKIGSCKPSIWFWTLSPYWTHFKK